MHLDPPSFLMKKVHGKKYIYSIVKMLTKMGSIYGPERVYFNINLNTSLTSSLIL